uniref:RNA-directed RNA polymerase n=1 Tax=Chromera velia CCMP2878 TaxID=1169474 RepID=A0A0G4HTX0_9ALVE|eukprot:Cvel_8505.t1-p1 / transcript=Cvel_8505.t1 / gene=Cvel_8505 / organism=Chromera_velia_CCMP2878 / gene_product=RNA-dependent RNA polymerase 2, putative / transcript_product=RNA-dependent RNA polymerase 2, putative / location=Cvel_scaffold470:60289-86521(-) / protein_length=3163 / sequence_SO=supercontig / SO=protein_coding / is_pseudo=false
MDRGALERTWTIALVCPDRRDCFERKRSVQGDLDDGLFRNLASFGLLNYAKLQQIFRFARSEREAGSVLWEPVGENGEKVAIATLPDGSTYTRIFQKDKNGRRVAQTSRRITENDLMGVWYKRIIIAKEGMMDIASKGRMDFKMKMGNLNIASRNVMGKNVEIWVLVHMLISNGQVAESQASDLMVYAIMPAKRADEPAIITALRRMVHQGQQFLDPIDALRTFMRRVQREFDAGIQALLVPLPDVPFSARVLHLRVTPVRQIFMGFQHVPLTRGLKRWMGYFRDETSILRVEYCEENGEPLRPNKATDDNILTFIRARMADDPQIVDGNLRLYPGYAIGHCHFTFLTCSPRDLAQSAAWFVKVPKHFPKEKQGFESSLSTQKIEVIGLRDPYFPHHHATPAELTYRQTLFWEPCVEVAGVNRTFATLEPDLEAQIVSGPNSPTGKKASAAAAATAAAGGAKQAQRRMSYTEGLGKMTLGLRQVIASQFRIDPLPSAMVVSFGSFKGVAVVCPHLQTRTMGAKEKMEREKKKTLQIAVDSGSTEPAAVVGVSADTGAVNGHLSNHLPSATGSTAGDAAAAAPPQTLTPGRDGYSAREGTSGLQIVLRDSMRCSRAAKMKGKDGKFLHTDDVLEIRGWSAFKPFFFDTHLVTALLTRDIEENYLQKIFAEALEAFRDGLKDRSCALKMLQRSPLLGTGEHMLTFKFVEAIHQLLLHGRVSVKDPFIRETLLFVRRHGLRAISRRACAFVKMGAVLIGVADDSGVLKKDEVYVQLRYPEWHPLFQERVRKGLSALHVLGGEGKRGVQVAVARAPCLNPGDIKTFKAVEKRELSHLVNVIVFPSTCEIPVPIQLNGGSCAGDEYAVWWDTRSVPHQQAPAFKYEDDVPLSICLEFPLNNRGPPPKAVTSQEKGRGGKGGAVTKSYGKVDQADKMLAVPDDVGGDGGEIGIAKKRHSMREALADRFIETLSLDRRDILATAHVCAALYPDRYQRGEMARHKECAELQDLHWRITKAVQRGFRIPRIDLEILHHMTIRKWPDFLSDMDSRRHGRVFESKALPGIIYRENKYLDQGDVPPMIRPHPDIRPKRDGKRQIVLDLGKVPEKYVGRIDAFCVQQRDEMDENRSCAIVQSKRIETNTQKLSLWRTIIFSSWRSCEDEGHATVKQPIEIEDQVRMVEFRQQYILNDGTRSPWSKESSSQYFADAADRGVNRLTLQGPENLDDNAPPPPFFVHLIPEGFTHQYVKHHFQSRMIAPFLAHFGRNMEITEIEAKRWIVNVAYVDPLTGHPAPNFPGENESHEEKAKKERFREMMSIRVQLDAHRKAKALVRKLKDLDWSGCVYAIPRDDYVSYGGKAKIDQNEATKVGLLKKEGEEDPSVAVGGREGDGCDGYCLVSVHNSVSKAHQSLQSLGAGNIKPEELSSKRICRIRNLPASTDLLGDLIVHLMGDLEKKVSRTAYKAGANQQTVDDMLLLPAFPENEKLGLVCKPRKEDEAEKNCVSRRPGDEQRPGDEVPPSFDLYIAWKDPIGGKAFRHRAEGGKSINIKGTELGLDPFTGRGSMIDPTTRMLTIDEAPGILHHMLKFDGVIHVKDLPIGAAEHDLRDQLNRFCKEELNTQSNELKECKISQLGAGLGEENPYFAQVNVRAGTALLMASKHSAVLKLKLTDPTGIAPVQKKHFDLQFWRPPYISENDKQRVALHQKPKPVSSPKPKRKLKNGLTNGVNASHIILTDTEADTVSDYQSVQSRKPRPARKVVAAAAASAGFDPDSESDVWQPEEAPPVFQSEDEDDDFPALPYRPAQFATARVRFPRVIKARIPKKNPNKDFPPLEAARPDFQQENSCSDEEQPKPNAWGSPARRDPPKKKEEEMSLRKLQELEWDHQANSIENRASTEEGDLSLSALSATDPAVKLDEKTRLIVLYLREMGKGHHISAWEVLFLLDKWVETGLKKKVGRSAGQLIRLLRQRLNTIVKVGRPKAERGLNFEEKRALAPDPDELPAVNARLLPTMWPGTQQQQQQSGGAEETAVPPDSSMEPGTQSEEASAPATTTPAGGEEGGEGEVQETTGAASSALPSAVRTDTGAPPSTASSVAGDREAASVGATGVVTDDEGVYTESGDYFTETERSVITDPESEEDKEESDEESSDSDDSEPAPRRRKAMTMKKRLARAKKRAGRDSSGSSSSSAVSSNDESMFESESASESDVSNWDAVEKWRKEKGRQEPLTAEMLTALGTGGGFLEHLQGGVKVGRFRQLRTPDWMWSKEMGDPRLPDQLFRVERSHQKGVVVAREIRRGRDGGVEGGDEGTTMGYEDCFELDEEEEDEYDKHNENIALERPRKAALARARIERRMAHRVVASCRQALDGDLLHPGWQEHTRAAVSLLVEYNEKMTSLMLHAGTTDELVLLSGADMLWEVPLRYSPDMRAHQHQFRDRVEILHRMFQVARFAEPDGTRLFDPGRNKEAAFARASAAYIVTYLGVGVASKIVLPGERTIGAARQIPPLLSFPWVVFGQELTAMKQRAIQWRKEHGLVLEDDQLSTSTLAAQDIASQDGLMELDESGDRIPGDISDTETVVHRNQSDDETPRRPLPMNGSTRSRPPKLLVGASTELMEAQDDSEDEDEDEDFHHSRPASGTQAAQRSPMSPLYSGKYAKIYPPTDDYSDQEDEEKKKKKKEEEEEAEIQKQEFGGLQPNGHTGTASSIFPLSRVSNERQQQHSPSPAPPRRRQSPPSTVRDREPQYSSPPPSRQRRQPPLSPVQEQEPQSSLSPQPIKRRQSPPSPAQEQQQPPSAFRVSQQQKKERETVQPHANGIRETQRPPPRRRQYMPSDSESQTETEEDEPVRAGYLSRRRNIRMTQRAAGDDSEGYSSAPPDNDNAAYEDPNFTDDDAEFDSPSRQPHLDTGVAERFIKGHLGSQVRQDEAARERKQSEEAERNGDTFSSVDDHLAKKERDFEDREREKERERRNGGSGGLRGRGSPHANGRVTSSSPDSDSSDSDSDSDTPMNRGTRSGGAVQNRKEMETVSENLQSETSSRRPRRKMFDSSSSSSEEEQSVREKRAQLRRRLGREAHSEESDDTAGELAEDEEEDVPPSSSRYPRTATTRVGRGRAGPLGQQGKDASPSAPPPAARRRPTEVETDSDEEEDRPSSPPRARPSQLKKGRAEEDSESELSG